LPVRASSRKWATIGPPASTCSSSPAKRPHAGTAEAPLLPPAQRHPPSPGAAAPAAPAKAAERKQEQEELAVAALASKAAIKAVADGFEGHGFECDPDSALAAGLQRALPRLAQALGDRDYSVVLAALEASRAWLQVQCRAWGCCPRT
jgi:hypothetical protein